MISTISKETTKANWNAGNIRYLRLMLKTPTRRIRWMIFRYEFTLAICRMTWLPYFIVRKCRESCSIGDSFIARLTLMGHMDTWRRILERRA